MADANPEIIAKRSATHVTMTETDEQGWWSRNVFDAVSFELQKAHGTNPLVWLPARQYKLF